MIGRIRGPVAETGALRADLRPWERVPRVIGPPDRAACGRTGGGR